MLLVVCQLGRVVIGYEDCKQRLVRFDHSFVSQMSVRLSLAPVVSSRFPNTYSRLSVIVHLRHSCYVQYMQIKIAKRNQGYFLFNRVATQCDRQFPGIP